MCCFKKITLPNFGPFLLSILLAFISCNQSSQSASNISGQTPNYELLQRITNLNKLNPELGLKQAMLLLNNDTVRNDKIVYYNLIEQIGILKAYSGDIDSSIFYLNKALVYWETDTSKMAKDHCGTNLNNIGFGYLAKGELENAIIQFNKALGHSIKTGSIGLEINSHLNLSDAYQGIGQYGKALEHIDKCIKLSTEIGDSIKLINALNAYAVLYTNCHLFEEAQEQFDLQYNYKRHFSPYVEFNFYNSKGRMFYLKQDFQQAKSEFLKGKSVVPHDDTYANMIILSNLAETYLLLNNPDSAKVYLDRVAEMGIGLSTMPIFNFNYNSLLGDYYWQRKEFENAKTAFETADLIAKQIDVDKTLQKLHLQRKTRFLISTKNYKEASVQLQDYINLNNKILQEDNLKMVAGLKYKFQRDTTVINQRTQLFVKEQELKNYRFQHLILVVSIVVLLILTVVIILYFRRTKALNYEKNMRKIAALKMENVRGHISPHFAFNILNNIWTIMDDRETAKAQFDNLMIMIRHSLINTEKIAIPLEDEIRFVKSYLELQNFRMDNALSIDWKIDQKVQLSSLVPGMILQIPVENSIKHGLSPKIGSKTLKISIEIESKILSIVIEDNGIGYNPKLTASNGTGTGLKVLTNTISLLNQVNAQKMSYIIQNRDADGETGTRVIVKIPLNYNFNLS